MVDFRKLMTDEQRERFDREQAYLARERAKLRAMTAVELANYAQHCVDNSASPRNLPAGVPVYDNAMWHIVLPELIRRHVEAGQIDANELATVFPAAPEITLGAALSLDGIFEWWSPHESTWRQLKMNVEIRKRGQTFTRRWMPDLARWDVWFEDIIIDVADCLRVCWKVDGGEAPPRDWQKLDDEALKVPRYAPPAVGTTTILALPEFLRRGLDCELEEGKPCSYSLPHVFIVPPQLAAGDLTQIQRNNARAVEYRVNPPRGKVTMIQPHGFDESVVECLRRKQRGAAMFERPSDVEFERVRTAIGVASAGVTDDELNALFMRAPEEQAKAWIAERLHQLERNGVEAHGKVWVPINRMFPVENNTADAFIAIEAGAEKELPAPCFVIVVPRRNAVELASEPPAREPDPA